MPVCTTCDLSFDSKQKLTVHSRSCAKFVKLTFPHGVVIDVPRDDNGNFMCFCTSKTCPRPFKTTSGIREHIKMTKSSWLGSPGVAVGHLDK
jgi:hypothetical protein